MKRFPRFRAVTLAALFSGLPLLSAAVGAQEQTSLSARPGQRTARATPAASQGGLRLSLNEAIGLAIANNQDLNVSVNEAEASRYDVLRNLGIFDPLAQVSATRSHTEDPATSQLVGAAISERDALDVNASIGQLLPTGGSFSLGYGTNRTATNSSFFFINPSYTSGFTLSARQPLLRNFGWDATTWLIRTSRNTRDIRYQEFIRDVQAVVNGVEQAYWDLVYSLQNLEVQKESRAISADLNRITRIRIDVGSLAPIDIVQTEVGIATAEQAIIIAEDQIGDAQDRLKRLLNFPLEQWAVPIVPTDEVRAELTPVQVAEGTAIAAQRRPEIRIATFNADTFRIRHDFYRNQARPQLDLVGSYGFTGLGGTTTIRDDNGNVIERTPGSYPDSFDNITDARSWSVGLVFSYPIFNRTGRGLRGESLYTWEAAKASLTAVEQNVLVEVRDAARAIDTASRSIVAARKGRELAERNLDAERKRFENGMTTSFQVTEIQRDLSLARTNELQALTVYRKAIAAYHFAIADILDWRGIRLDEVPEPGTPDIRIWHNEP